MRPSGSKKPTAKKKTDPLRKKAAGMLAKQKERLRKLSALELNKLVHELGTHQIELEMQNEEMRRAQAEIESSRRKYADLYDFSPVGYFTFDRNGSIREVNHTGAGMLGLDKRSLINKPFQNIIEPADGRAAFRGHLAEVFRTQTLQTCEVDLRGKNGILFAAQLQSIVANIGEGTIDTCQTALSDITERKKAEQALRESEERLSLAHRAANIGAFEWNVQTGANIWTPQLETMYGLDRGEFGRTQLAWEQMVHPEDRAAAVDLVRQTFKTGEPVEGEWRVVWRDGSVHWISGRFQAFMDDAGTPLRLSGVNLDITERKRGEEALRREAQILAQVHDSVIATDLDGRITLWNKGAECLYGYTSDEALGRSVSFLYFDEDQSTINDRVIAPVLASGQHELEIRTRPKPGQATFVHLSLSVLRDEYGSPCGLIGYALDITERKLAEDSLRKAKDLSDALNRINKAVHSTFDFDEIMRRVITEAGDAMGCDSAAISLRKKERWVIAYAHGLPQDVTGSHLHDEEYSHAVLSLKTSKPVVIEDAIHDARLNTEHMKKHGIRSILIVPLVAGEEHLGAIFFNHHTTAGSFSDAQVDFTDKLASTITLAIENARLFEERLRAEERVNNLNEELKRSLFELEAVNIELETFSYSVSHDLRAPLRSIEGFTTAIIEDSAATLDETGRDYFNRIVAASRRMSQLIDAMLHMARLTRSEIREQVVNLSGLAEGIVAELRRGNPERQAEFLIAPDIKVHGDTGMLRIVIENLLDNAFKFTSRHRTAKIEFGSMDMEGKTVYFVRDDGAGFDMRFADKLFKPFKRLHTESEFPGIGIGLATAHRIISRHNGRIWAESEPEKGATFYFTL